MTELRIQQIKKTPLKFIKNKFYQTVVKQETIAEFLRSIKTSACQFITSVNKRNKQICILVQRIQALTYIISQTR